MSNLYIIFFILSATNFGFAIYYFRISIKSADKISKKIINEINKGKEQIIGNQKPHSSVTIKADNININQYDFSQVIKTLNSNIDHFNKTNKNVNIATGIVSTIAGIALLISSFISLFK